MLGRDENIKQVNKEKALKQVLRIFEMHPSLSEKELKYSYNCNKDIFGHLPFEDVRAMYKKIKQANKEKALKQIEVVLKANPSLEKEEERNKRARDAVNKKKHPITAKDVVFSVPKAQEVLNSHNKDITH